MNVLGGHAVLIVATQAYWGCWAGLRWCRKSAMAMVSPITAGLYCQPPRAAPIEPETLNAACRVVKAVADGEISDYGPAGSQPAWPATHRCQQPRRGSAGPERVQRGPARRDNRPLAESRTALITPSRIPIGPLGGDCSAAARGDSCEAGRPHPPRCPRRLIRRKGFSVQGEQLTTSSWCDPTTSRRAMCSA
jgi:hypothetical protein